MGKGVGVSVGTVGVAGCRVRVGVGVAVGVSVDVGVQVGVGVRVGEGVTLGVGVLVGVLVDVGVTEGVKDGVRVGTSIKTGTSLAMACTVLIAPAGRNRPKLCSNPGPTVKMSTRTAISAAAANTGRSQSWRSGSPQLGQSQ